MKKSTQVGNLKATMLTKSRDATDLIFNGLMKGQFSIMKDYKCDFCESSNASWLSHSVHADCINLDGFGKLLPKDERECPCDCQIPDSEKLSATSFFNLTNVTGVTLLSIIAYGSYLVHQFGAGFGI